MSSFVQALTLQWKTSPRFRAALGLALLYFLLRLGVSTSWQMGWLVVEGWPSSTDLQLYWETGEKFREQEDLYFEPKDNFSVFVYAPPFALLMSLIRLIPFKVALTLYLLVILAAYAAIYGCWYRLFRRCKFDTAAQQMIRWLPLWLASMAIIYDLNYLNSYTVMALLATLLIEAVLDERPGRALLCLALILPTKPHWAFALALPFVLRRWRFGFKLLVGSVIVYAAVTGFTLLVGGPHYVIEQYGDYLHTVRSIPDKFPWATFDDHQVGYNHSLMQVMFFFFGHNSRTLVAVTLVKAALWLPLLAAAWLALRRPAEHPPAWGLEWALALYTGTFLLIDVINEMTLGVVVFTVLHVTTRRPAVRRIMHLVAWPYFLGDLLGILAYGVYLPDPMESIPLVLIAQGCFYTILVSHLLGKVGVRGPGRIDRWHNAEGGEIPY